MWTLTHGPITTGLDVCHRCDNPGCVNPAHLFLGTHADNMRDMQQKDRHARGERSGRASLTDAAVMEIRRLAKQGVLQSEIAKQFNTPNGNVSQIVNGKAWKHVPMEAA